MYGVLECFVKVTKFLSIPYCVPLLHCIKFGQTRLLVQVIVAVKDFRN